MEIVTTAAAVMSEHGPRGQTRPPWTAGTTICSLVEMAEFVLQAATGLTSTRHPNYQKLSIK